MRPDPLLDDAFARMHAARERACPTGQAVAISAGLAGAGIVLVGLAALVLLDRALRGRKLLEAQR